jgi:hypothetical protein
MHSCHALFCYSSNKPKNAKTISVAFPHGKFFYGISSVTDLLNECDCVQFTNVGKTCLINEIS